MNNAFVTEHFVEKPDKNATPEGEAKRLEETVAALKSLQHSRAFKVFLVNIVLPAIEATDKQLRRERDPVVMHRLQGELEGLENYTSLRKLEALYQGRLNASRRTKEDGEE